MIEKCLQNCFYPEKTVDILRRHHWFPYKMTSEEGAQKFHTDDMSLPRTLIFRQYGISALIPQVSICRETSGGVSGEIFFLFLGLSISYLASNFPQI